MRVRFSSSRGLSVVEHGGMEIIGTIDGILLHPDSGVVEGFFVNAAGFLAGGTLFLASLDIEHWGTRVVVRDADVLGPVEDRVRLQSLLRQSRTVLGQPMVTESGAMLGTCRDVQFNTKDFRVEWLFPKKFFWWGTPVPVSQVIDVRREAIVVRDPVEPAEEAPIIPPIPEAA